MATFPARNQKAPNYWDEQLKEYIDEASSDEALAQKLGDPSSAAHELLTTTYVPKEQFLEGDVPNGDSGHPTERAK